jgi:hypothetical protein
VQLRVEPLAGRIEWLDAGRREAVVQLVANHGDALDQGVVR